MKNEIAIPIEKINLRQLVWVVVLGGIASFLPFVLHSQFITGPVINAIFILSLFILGIRYAVFIALVPSLMALSGGLLPVVLAPVIPFIMLSNIIFIFCIEYFQKYDWNFAKKFWIGVIAGAFLKFLFLFISTSWIANILTEQKLIVKVAQMMSWPQFITAILGGFIAWYILFFYKIVNK